MIQDSDGMEIICAGQYYHAKCTKNEAESFMVRDTL